MKKLTLNFNYNTIDHIMDNYTFRPGGTRGMEVKRTQYNIRSVLDMTFSPRDTGAVGIDVGHEEHTFTPAMKGVPRGRENTDMTIGNLGLFMEYNHNLTERSRLLSGLRWDRITNHYHRYSTFTPGNTTDNAVSGFVRWERTSKNRPLTFYVGLGHAERPADYWESYHTWRMHGALHPGATRPAKEKNTQLDLGWVYAGKKTNASLSLYYAHVDDFILRKPVGEYGNVDARLYGLEAEVTRTVSPRWTLGASLAYTRGDDRTNDAPLPQIAPLEANLTAKYSHRKMEANAVWRLVSRQNRYHKGYGSVTGTDYGPTGGFGILSLSLAYRPDENLTLSLGVDNLLNKTYAEFVNYSEAAIPALGISAGGHITEPGRTIWFKSNYKF